jgi:hypothetical protein
MFHVEQTVLNDEHEKARVAQGSRGPRPSPTWHTHLSPQRDKFALPPDMTAIPLLQLDSEGREFSLWGASRS